MSCLVMKDKRALEKYVSLLKNTIEENNLLNKLTLLVNLGYHLISGLLMI